MAMEMVLRQEDVARFRKAGCWPDLVLTDCLWQVAQRDPGRLAIVDPRHGRFTYGRLATDVVRAAHGLRALGLAHGDVAIVELPNWYQFAVLHLALTAIGAITVNVPTIYRQHELSFIARSASAKLLVVPDVFRRFDYRPLAWDVCSGAPALTNVIVVGDAGDAGTSYDEFMAQPWEEAGGLTAIQAFRPDPNDVTLLGFTSGTTGDMKAAMLNSNTLIAANVGLASCYGLTERDCIFVPSPVGHGVGLLHGVRQAIYLGAPAVYLDLWDPAVALDLIARERCTFASGATPFLRDLAAAREGPGSARPLPLRVFVSGGAPVPEQVRRDARDRFPGTFITALWGMMECGPGSYCPPDAPEEKILRTDGRPAAGMELLVVDPDGQALPPDTPGELLVRGPQNFVGYYQRPDLNQRLIRPDGFFHTGDEATLDADGYVTITGRIKDQIIRGGMNIAAVEIEQVLFAHPAIADAAVVGMPDERLGERICAFAILHPGQKLTLADVQAAMERAGLAKQKWPERLEVVNVFPMTPAGKVQKHLLRTRIAEQLRREQGGNA